MKITVAHITTEEADKITKEIRTFRGFLDYMYEITKLTNLSITFNETQLLMCYGDYGYQELICKTIWSILKRPAKIEGFSKPLHAFYYQRVMDISNAEDFIFKI